MGEGPEGPGEFLAEACDAYLAEALASMAQVPRHPHALTQTHAHPNIHTNTHPAMAEALASMAQLRRSTHARTHAFKL